MESRLISEITWKQYHEKAADGLIILPVGSTEQHSSHLPLGTDSIIAEQIALVIADRVDALVAPTLTYGYKSQPVSGGGAKFPGTIDLNAATLINLVFDVLKELKTDGWQKILLLSGHLENLAFLTEAADLLVRDQQTPFPKVLILGWWEPMSDEMIPQLFDEVEFPGWELEHAGICETSIMMHFRPDLVNSDMFLEEGLESAPPYRCFPQNPNLIHKSGNIHTPRSSSPEKGKLIVEHVVDKIEKIIFDEF